MTDQLPLGSALPLTYLRHRAKSSRNGRTFGPLRPEHPFYSMPCLLCGLDLGGDDQELMLIALGPGEDPEARARAGAGRPYNAIAITVHVVCALGTLPQEDKYDIHQG